MWCLVGQRVHWVCEVGEIDLKGMRVRAVTGAPQMSEDLSVLVGRQLISLDRSVHFETVLLLETEASTVEAILAGLRLSGWCLRRMITAGDVVFLEGSRKGGRRLRTLEMGDGSLESTVGRLVACPEVGSLLVDPFAFDLRSLRGAEGAGLHSVSLATSVGISRHILQASEFPLKVQLPAWGWLPSFLVRLGEVGKIREAARCSGVSRPRVYQAMDRVEDFRQVGDAVRGRG